MSFKGSLLGGGGTVVHDATLTGDGTGGSPLGVAVPLTLGNGTASVSLASGPQGIFAETTDATNAGVAIWGRGRTFGTYGDVVDGSEIPHAWGELGRLFNAGNYGVVGVSLDPAGAAMLAQYAGAGAGAAVVMDGALKVAGANPTAFSFKAVDVECGGYCGIISNPLTDGDPAAMLIVTHDYTQDGLYLPSPFSTWYDPGINKWTIYFDDHATSIAGYAFNILVIKH
jgi:hypothetical protein